MSRNQNMLDVSIRKVESVELWNAQLAEGAYFDFGGAAYPEDVSTVQRNSNRNIICKAFEAIPSFPLTLIFVAPFTDFSNELAISTEGAQERACDSHRLG